MPFTIEPLPSSSTKFKNTPLENALDSVVRHGTRTAARVAETALGTPGSIESLGRAALNIGSEITRGKPAVSEESFLPTADKLRELGNEHVPGYKELEPHDEAEKRFDQFAQDVASVFLPLAPGLGGGAPFLKALKVAGYGNLAALAARKITGSETAGDLVKAGTMLTTSMFGAKPIKQIATEAYEAAKASIPEDARVSTRALAPVLKNIEKELSVGLKDVKFKDILKDNVQQVLDRIKFQAPEAKAPSGVSKPLLALPSPSSSTEPLTAATTKAARIANFKAGKAAQAKSLARGVEPGMVAKDLKNGTLGAYDVLKIKQNLNSIISDNLYKNKPNEYSALLFDLKKGLGDVLTEYGKDNQTFIDNLRKGDEIWSALENAGPVTKFLKDNVNENTKRWAITGALFGLSNPITTATTLHTLEKAKPISQAFDALNNSAEARKHYLGVLKSAAAQNTRELTKNIVKLERALKESIGAEEESEPTSGYTIS